MDNIVVARGPVAKDRDVMAQGPDVVCNIMALGESVATGKVVIA